MAQADDEERLFAVLDTYVDKLAQGRADRQAVLAKHPQLTAALDCLEALHELVPAGPQGNEQAAEPVTLVCNALPPLDLDAAVPPAPQRDFGDFELLEEIGRGGMGVVFRARQKSLERVVAIKMILASHVVTAEQVRRLYAEAKAAAAVTHPHVVRIFEVGQVHGQHYFAMEYIEGISLAQRLAAGKLDETEAVRCVAAVARAVEHLHRHGIVHRDLKPSNILLDASHRPYVTDFGLARGLADAAAASSRGMIAGTPSYMAPEQAAAQDQEIGPASDVYSLGAILYECLAGRPPFREPNPLDTLVQVLERPPAWPRQFNPRVSRELEMIVLKCLEKAPSQRYASAAALADDLERFLAGQDLEARPPRGWYLRRWMRRQPALALRLTALAGFYAVELLNYHLLGQVTSSFHQRMTLILVIWVVASVAFQYGLSPRTGHPSSPPGKQAAGRVKYAWALTDATLLLVVALIADGVASPVVIAFPVLVVLSGLWFQRRMVWFTTALAAAAYLGLVADFYLLRTHLQARFDTNADRHVYFVVALLVLGGVVAWQVGRLRALAHYYQKWRFE